MKLTQRQLILKLLKDRGTLGISNYELVFLHSCKQAATRVHELKKLGYNITTSPHKNSVKYHLVSEPKPVPVTEYEWIVDKETNTARQVKKGEQLSVFR